jgi:hypothetical protein
MNKQISPGIFNLAKFENTTFRCTQGGGGWEGGMTQPPFKKLINENAIEPKIGHPWQFFFLKALTPL